MRINAVSLSVALTVAAISCGGPERDAPVAERSVDFELLWSVGDGPGEEGLVCSTDTMLAASAARDRFYLGPICERGRVAVLDSSGDPIGVIGSLGPGPGEMQAVGMIFVDPSDRLHVFQVPRGHTVFGPDQQVVSTSDVLPISFWNLFLADGRSVRNMRLRSEDRAGMTLHLVEDAADQVLGSFAPIDDVDLASDGRNLWRSVATATGETFWAAHHFAYVVEEWDPSGGKLRTIARSPDWWVDKPDFQGTVLSDIAVRDRQLWVLAYVPTFDGDALPSGVGADPELGAYYDTVIEVIDLASERVIAQARREELLPRWVGDLMFSHRDAGDGIIAMDVWRATLEEAATPEPVARSAARPSARDHQARQREAMVRMRAIATANGRMRVETGSYAATLAELQRAGYLEGVPLTDGWGNPFVYALDEGTYTIVSYGSDGVPGPDPPGTWMLEPYEPDIVMVDALFTQAPRGQ